MKTYLVCASAEHAELVDQLIAAKLRDEELATCNAWSGVWTDGRRYGVTWAAPVSSLFGVPEDFPELELVEDVAEEWVPLPEPEVEPDAL